MKKTQVLLAILLCLTVIFTACTPTSSPQDTSTIAPSSLATETPETTTTLPSETDDSIVYVNTEYGFSFTLPQSWEGYTIVTSNWEGTLVKGGISSSPSPTSTSETVAITGPMISIRNPKWTASKPYQDIPIMVFTLSQWTAVEHSYPTPSTASNSYPPNQDDIIIGAAPIGPTELGRNSQYVFALPARYNFSSPEGVEEVEEIINSDPLQAN